MVAPGAYLPMRPAAVSRSWSPALSWCHNPGRSISMFPSRQCGSRRSVNRTRSLISTMTAGAVSDNSPSAICDNDNLARWSPRSPGQEQDGREGQEGGGGDQRPGGGGLNALGPETGLAEQQVRAVPA